LENIEGIHVGSGSETVHPGEVWTDTADGKVYTYNVRMQHNKYRKER
jgi:hypothetical protein